MNDQNYKSIKELVPVTNAGKGTWYSETDVVSTGLPLFKTYGKKFPKGYLNATQCKSIYMPVEDDEEPVAFKRNNIKGLYHPLYERTNSDYCKKNEYNWNNVPSYLTRKPPYLITHNSIKRERPEPVAYTMNGSGGKIEALYERTD